MITDLPYPLTNIEVPPLDMQAALHRFLDDQGFFVEMCHGYIQNLPRRMDDLRDALEKNDIAAFAYAAHNLKGVSANFSAEPVRQITSQMEEAGRNGDLSAGLALMMKLEIEAERLVEYMQMLGAV